MSFFQDALDNAHYATTHPNDNVQVGDRVKMLGDYSGETGVVIEDGKNMFGLRLLTIKLDGQKDDEYKPCAYPHEVEKITKE